MSLSIAVIVAGSLSLVALAGGIAGAVGNRRQQRSKWASQTWRDVTLRNGVTALSPFHSRSSSFNAPGMVRTYPRSQAPTQAASVSASVSNARPPAASVVPSAVSTVVHTSTTPETELPHEPLELSDPPHEAEGARCRRLYRQGMSQTKVIADVWGVPKGGSKKYYEARRRFRAHVAEIATGDLLASIQSEGGV